MCAYKCAPQTKLFSPASLKRLKSATHKNRKCFKTISQPNSVCYFICIAQIIHRCISAYKNNLCPLTWEKILVVTSWQNAALASSLARIDFLPLGEGVIQLTPGSWPNNFWSVIVGTFSCIRGWIEVWLKVLSRTAKKSLLGFPKNLNKNKIRMKV